MKRFTRNGRDFFEVASLLQKSLRRGDVVLASAAVNELLPTYGNYVWNRLMTVSAEDCADFVTSEVVALYDAWVKVNQSVPAKTKGRIFFAKAVIILARAKHSRDADELNILVADRLPPEELDRLLKECTETISRDDVALQGSIPSWVYDVHTRRGKSMGKTKAMFLRDERDALTDPHTVFANLDEMIDSQRYVEPQMRFD